MAQDASLYSYCLFAALLSFRGTLLLAAANSFGINYGRIADNLPPPNKVVELVNSIKASKVRIYDADPKVLTAFANTNMELTIGLGNEFLSNVADVNGFAETWISNNVKPYLPATKITCITIGNEVLSSNDTSLSNKLLPAMQDMHSALMKLGLDKQIFVTTAHSLEVLKTSFPPSSGTFSSQVMEEIKRILKFHSETGSPFLINAYPFFAYKDNPRHVQLDFVLFESNQPVLDQEKKLNYYNMLFMQIDAVYSAMCSLGYYKIPIQVSETGWPSKGDENEVGATVENAKKYNSNLIKLLFQKNGTPMMPKRSITVFLFALFNEDKKPGPESERNYGLFNPDMTHVYDLEINKEGDNIRQLNISSTPISMNQPSGDTPPPAEPLASSTGYFYVSSSKDKLDCAITSHVLFIGMLLISHLFNLLVVH